MITHPEKVMFPDSGITKGELAEYYALVAPIMVPHLAGRPVTLERFHNGIGEKGFFQKNVAKGAPEWLERVAVPKTDGVVNYAIVRDARGRGIRHGFILPVLLLTFMFGPAGWLAYRGGAAAYGRAKGQSHAA